MDSDKDSPFTWDSYSDQPKIISDRKLKRRLRLAGLPVHIRSLLVSVFSLPLITLAYLFTTDKKTPNTCDSFYGLCVNLDKEPELTPELINELGIKKILVRIPLHKYNNLSKYITFLESLTSVEIHINILQDHQDIENPDAEKDHFHKVFSALAPYSKSFQIGNAVNRLKWGFTSMEEYLRFFAQAQSVRNLHFPLLELSGSSVIDFEPVSTIRSLFQRITAPYDKVAALLYVDRRGAPENKQYGFFDLRRKIRFIAATKKASGQGASPLIITETNWPLINTAPYAPAVGECCVSEEEAANYLTRYFLEALSTGHVETVYWHQLIAPGYGLTDNRGDRLRKHPAFHAYKNLIKLTSSSHACRYQRHGDVFRMDFEGIDQVISVFWAISVQPFPDFSALTYIDRNGCELPLKPKTIDGSPIYCIRHSN